jgi:pantetheine-phosphate adenylyltransferase
MASAIYPGSFDPVTNGHLDIAVRGARLFDRLIIAVYDAPPKKLWFSTDERVAMFRRAVADIPNVEVHSYTGLTVNFAQDMGAQAIVRGLRAIQDFENEFAMASMNKHLVPEIEEVYLFPDTHFQFVSSSLLKEVVSLGGDIEPFVPDFVRDALRNRLHERVAVA